MMHTFASMLAGTVLLASTLFMPQPASATVVLLNAQATIGGGYNANTPFMPPDTVVTANLRFDVSGSTSVTSSGPVISGVQGAFSWNDGTARTFDVSGGHNSYQSSSGFVGIEFTGNGPSINGLTTPWFWIDFAIGVNPFTDNLDWDDLLLGASVTGFQLMASNAGGGVGVQLWRDASGSVALASVPEPGTFALAAVALVAGLLTKRREPGRKLKLRG